MISSVMPGILMSICSEVMPSAVPATLKSMSPRWSSSPRMSESTAKPSFSRIRPMAMPRDRLLERHAGVHQRQRPAAHRGHRRGAVGLGDLRDHPDGVGELLLGRQHRPERPPGELAVADVAPAGRVHPAGLAHRIGREVVVQQEALLVGALQRVDELLVVAGAQGGDHQGLGLAAGEQGRAVGPRQDRHLRRRWGGLRSTARPSMRLPVSRMPRRTTSASHALKTPSRAWPDRPRPGWPRTCPGPRRPWPWRRRRASWRAPLAVIA